MTSTSAALSAISAISAGRLLPHADSFYCPADIKEIKEIFIPLGEAISAISAISAGHYYLMRKVFIVPQSSALPLRSSKSSALPLRLSKK